MKYALVISGSLPDNISNFMTQEQGLQVTITVIILSKTTLKIVFLHQLCLIGTLAPLMKCITEQWMALAI